MHIILSVGTSKHLDSIVMGNHEELKYFNHISTNLIDSTESYNKDYILSINIFILKIAKTFRALNQSPWQSA
jgi:hypothetical protein